MISGVSMGAARKKGRGHTDVATAFAGEMAAALPS
jgi:hypothetical protein